MNILNMGILEVLVILVLALVLFGPTRLISLASSLRKAFYEFQRAAEGIAAAAAAEVQAPDQRPADERAEFVAEDNGPTQAPDIEDSPPEDRTQL